MLAMGRGMVEEQETIKICSCVIYTASIHQLRRESLAFLLPPFCLVENVDKSLKYVIITYENTSIVRECQRTCVCDIKNYSIPKIFKVGK